MVFELGSERCELGPVIRLERIAGGKQCRVLRIELHRVTGRGRGEDEARQTVRSSALVKIPPLIEYYRHFSCQMKTSAHGSFGPFRLAQERARKAFAGTQRSPR